MKTFFKWLIRIICIGLILAASATLVRCFLHRDDDYSLEAVVGADAVISRQQALETGGLEPAGADPVMEKIPQEGPVNVIVYCDGDITQNRKTVTATVAFGNVTSSIEANLTWYLDGEVIQEDHDRLLVEGSTVSCPITMNAKEEGADVAAIEVRVAYDDTEVIGATEIAVERMGAEDSIVIRTEEITVTALSDTKTYQDGELTVAGETMKSGDTALLLGYEKLDNGKYLKLQNADGDVFWAKDTSLEISQEDCTTDTDYVETEKIEFVNSMGYDSKTEFLVWVSLYTQKVNVFSGYQGHWELLEAFDCSTGVNSTPTSTGTFEISALSDRWELSGGASYVSPVLVFNGGEAFTSQPKDADTGYVIENQIGKPASGGSVRMRQDDIEWLVDRVPLGTMVVVY